MFYEELRCQNQEENALWPYVTNMKRKTKPPYFYQEDKCILTHHVVDRSSKIDDLVVNWYFPEKEQDEFEKMSSAMFTCSVLEVH